MPRTLLLAAALTACTALTSVSSVAQAQETLYRWKWEGEIRIFQQSGEDCQGDFVSTSNTRAIYQPSLVDVFDRETTLTIFHKRSTEMIKNANSLGQFHGFVYYNLYSIAEGSVYGTGSDFFSSQWTQTPEVVDETTTFITLSGELSEYGGVGDCTVKLRGSFVAVDSTEPPPPYAD